MKTLLWVAGLCLVCGSAWSGSYQVTYGWNAPTWLPSDTPSYGIRYRLAGGTPVSVPNTLVPGGVITWTGTPGTTFELCPQNKNGTLSNPDCTLPSHWLMVGNLPFPLTNPPLPGGFSATIIYTGP
jgi:hypothetical protein